MKNPRLQLILLLGAAAAFAAGCSHLDLTGAGEADRVLTGQVTLRVPATLPADAVLTVSVIDPNPTPAVAPPLTTSATPAPAPSPVELGEQTVNNLGDGPYSFRIEYRADDEALRRGLTIEARISSGRHLLYSNSGSYGLGTSDVGDPHDIVVDRMGP